MAIVTRQEASYGDGTVQFSYDYDDTTLRIVMFRCVNTSAFDAYGRVTQDSNGARTARFYEATFLANSGLNEIPISTGQAQRLQLTINPDNGKLTNVSIETRWPA